MFPGTSCVTTETRHLGRLGQLGEFEQSSKATQTRTVKQSTGTWCVKHRCTANLWQPLPSSGLSVHHVQLQQCSVL